MKKIVWDWNGTLFDDVQLCLSCINALLRRYQVPVLKDLSAYRKVFGFPIKDYYREIGFDFSKTPFEKLAQEYMDMYQDRSYQCDLVTGALDVLSRAKEMGIHQTVLSASRKDYLLSQIRAKGIQDHVDDIYGIENIYAKSKLDLAMVYKETCSKDDEIWFVGDSLHDFEAANVMGANCLLVTSGHQSYDRLKETGVPVFDSLENCLEVIYEGNTNRR